MTDTKSLVGKFSGLSAEQQSKFLAKLKKKSISKKQADSEPKISKVPQKQLEQGVPLSHSQQRLWFLDQLGESNKASYNIPISVMLKGQLNIDSVLRAFESIIKRHDVLRSQIVVEGGEPRQVVRPSIDFTLPITEIEQAQLNDALHAQARIPFDLEKDALFRAKLFKLNAQEHVLFLNMHHIISDGWSLEVLKKEFAHYYSSQTHLPPLDVQYQDFANWQRDTEHEAGFKEDLRYWEESLAGLPECLALPLRKERPDVLTAKGAILCDALPLDVLHTVEQFSCENQVSTFVTLMSAFNVLISKYTNTSDIAVGTPVANRHKKQIESNIGLFVNTLVIRNEVKQSDSFIELLRSVNKVVRASYEHQKVPFEKVVEHLKPVRSKSYAPLFQVMLVYQDFPSSIQLHLDGISMTEIPLSSSTSKFDLTLYVQRENTGFNLRAEYSSELFEESDIEQLISHYKQLLVRLCCEPHVQIAATPLLTERDYAQLSQWQGVQSDTYKEHTLGSLILEQVKNQPNAVAVQGESSSITYAELYRQALLIAEQLKGTNLAEKSIVALVIKSTSQQVCAAVGALLSGLVFVPIDASQPVQRQKVLLELSGASIILSDEPGQFNNIPEIDVNGLSGRITTAELIHTEMTPTEQNNLACVIFDAIDQQSMPTGVQISQSSIVNAVLDMNERLSITKEDKLLAISEYDTEHSIYERFSILVAGGCIVSVEEAHQTSSEVWFNKLIKHGITIWHSSSYQAEILWHYLKEFHSNDKILLSRVCLVGQNVNRTLLENIRNWDEKLAIYCFEGVAECGTWSVISRYTDQDAFDTQSVIRNQKVYVLNTALVECPVLVSGHIYRSGVELATSYWQQAEGENERFVTHPQTGERLFKSGEIGRRLPCGRVEILHYDEERISFRGRQLSLNEVAYALRTNPSIADARVEIIRNKQLNEALVAKVATNMVVTKAELFQHLQKLLPAYMTPRYYDIGGSINTDAANYSEQALANLQVHNQYVSARTVLEVQLSHIWCKVLGVPYIGVKDQFIELGGSSLQAIQVVNEINDALDIKVTMKDIFSCATIAGLSNKYRRTEHNSSYK
ncbi:hypothetical protein N480_21615 [Pseudoalteromonas luteoviolacea S2607]|uniref:non-ribosomal peptide synthetase n=1 Tax=Pseudoalteromonas luteoviolacea TaxID=43657 RepID=UPI0007B047CB|nr:condensation domain-containing protein [Pseudoalteromonas luteoviolacea]KZN34204.1 hypothetical protein N480_21615 [Pseudoalteromonas luteoviolacea S2607]